MRRAGDAAQRRAGAKGFGLFTEEALGEGQFVIEYIGEVLEEEEYLRRKEFYQASGQRHYYFMNVGNGEVIDACRKARPARVPQTLLQPGVRPAALLPFERGQLRGHMRLPEGAHPGSLEPCFHCSARRQASGTTLS